MASVKGVNTYHKELNEDDFIKKEHREVVGGFWDELGKLQYDFLLKQGLKQHNKLLDVGCGCLRGGLHFIKFLEAGCYSGMDINASLIRAAEIELQEAGLKHKSPYLLVNDEFDFSLFENKFNYMLSVSVFTHLPMNMIIRCLVNAQKVLENSGKYYATFFVAPDSAHIEDIVHQPGNVKSSYDSDPFHYSIEEIEYMASLAKLKSTFIGDWDHPRNQKMVVFEKEI